MSPGPRQMKGNEMKERPILFSAPMVRAILAGRKTQTRRLVKPQDSVESHDDGGGFVHAAACPGYCDYACGAIEFTNEAVGATPHGTPGDRLWVRETHAQLAVGEGMERSVPQCVAYRATCDADGGFDYVNGRGEVMRLNVTKWTPSIFMPRWASRLTLEVTGIRVERLQDIGEEDARSEGVEPTDYYGPTTDGQHGCWKKSAKYPYEKLWETINGKRAPWKSNPWVWVVEFKRVLP